MVAAMVCLAGAQELRHISNEEARRHLINEVVPDFPEMAQGAGIYGVVTLEIIITGSGNVSNPKGVMGDPILVQAALNAVKKWEFKLFMVKGQPEWVRATIQVDFSPGSLALLLAKFGQQMRECDTGIAPENFADIYTRCERALEMATKLPQRFVRQKERAYYYAGTAAYNLGKVDVALKYFQQQLIFAQQAAFNLDAGMNPLHTNLAHAYEANGKLREANVEYIAAERVQEIGLAELESRREGFGPYMYYGIKADYEHRLRIILEDHARALRRMAKIKDAEALEQRAAVLAESQ
jgi:TonB family protein